MTIYTVYKITNNINDKLYIGFTKNGIKSRMRNHRQSMRRSNNKLATAMRKHGVNNFHIEEIYQSKDVEDALKTEAILIEEYCCIEEGYNTHKGGTAIKGKHKNKSCKNKKSEEVLLKEQIQKLQEQLSKMLFDHMLRGGIMPDPSKFFR